VTRASIPVATGSFDCQVTIDVFASNKSIMPDGLTVSAWEARVLGKLGDHPNVARVVDQWEDDQAAIMVSRYFPGGTLLDLIARSRASGEDLPAERILQLGPRSAMGLPISTGAGSCTWICSPQRAVRRAGDSAPGGLRHRGAA
jgi:hypothetical protein